MFIKNWKIVIIYLGTFDRQSGLHLYNLDIKRNIVQLGVILMVLKGAWLNSGLKKDAYHTGVHLGRKNGGQGDLHFYNLNIRRNIVKGADSISGWKKIYKTVEVTEVGKMEVKVTSILKILKEWRLSRSSPFSNYISISISLIFRCITVVHLIIMITLTSTFPT